MSLCYICVCVESFNDYTCTYVYEHLSFEWRENAHVFSQNFPTF